MKKTFLILMILAFYSTVSAQFITILEVDELIEGVCDNSKIYALFSILEGQVEPVPPISREEILNKLNTEVSYLKEHPKSKYKGMVNMIINCKGEVVKCEMENTDKSELDKQIVAIFNSLEKWKAGKLDGKDVDSNVLFSFKIIKGRFTFDLMN